MKDKLLLGIADILELPSVTEETPLAGTEGWDSLAVVCTVTLIDDVANAQVSGLALAACETVDDVLRIAGVREQQVIGAGDMGSLGSIFGAATAVEP